ncbi:MAG: hypothetical protein BMS9Abin37_3170 [Acidobacteriota bacterium]|nr:MAG: hypothetical protein BMS9Abin37_3170 [Acidobacteriota bacterium]
MRNFLSTTVLFLLSSLAASPVWSQVESVEMRVDGLACPFCAYGLEKRIKDVPGVSKIEIRVADGVLLLEADKDEAIALDQLEPAVKKAGFTAREITATAVGSIATVDEQRVLEVSGTDTELILEENPTVNELLAKLRGSKRVRVTGRLEERTPQGHHAHPFTMRVDSFEILSAETE